MVDHRGFWAAQASPAASGRRTGRRAAVRASVAVAALTAGFAVAATTTSAGAVPTGSRVSAAEYDATASAQIAALQQLKRSLSPSEAKLDSRLVLTARVARDPRVAAVDGVLAVDSPAGGPRCWTRSPRPAGRPWTSRSPP